MRGSLFSSATRVLPYRQWKATISVPPPVGFASVSKLSFRLGGPLLTIRSHPTEPLCTYDPVDGLPLAPDTEPLEKIKALEEQLSESDGPFFRFRPTDIYHPRH